MHTVNTSFGRTGRMKLHDLVLLKTYHVNIKTDPAALCFIHHMARRIICERLQHSLRRGATM